MYYGESEISSSNTGVWGECGERSLLVGHVLESTVGNLGAQGFSRSAESGMSSPLFSEVILILRKLPEKYRAILAFIHLGRRNNSISEAAGYLGYSSVDESHRVYIHACRAFLAELKSAPYFQSTPSY